jgi:hypothetical protein
MASETNVLDKRIDITLVDPWDFVTVNGSGPFVADVLQFGHDESTRAPALLLELHVPLKCNAEECKFFVATARHNGVALEELKTGKPIVCNLTGIPAEKAKGANPFDLSWWRGGTAAIADLSLHK